MLRRRPCIRQMSLYRQRWFGLVCRSVLLICSKVRTADLQNRMITVLGSESSRGNAASAEKLSQGFSIGRVIRWATFDQEIKPLCRDGQRCHIQPLGFVHIGAEPSDIVFSTNMWKMFHAAVRVEVHVLWRKFLQWRTASSGFSPAAITLSNNEPSTEPLTATVVIFPGVSLISAWKDSPSRLTNNRCSGSMR